jgi:hypothetical protein
MLLGALENIRPNLVRPERFELPTNWFEASYSIQLSYGRVEVGLYRFFSVEEGPIAISLIFGHSAHRPQQYLRLAGLPIHCSTHSRSLSGLSAGWVCLVTLWRSFTLTLCALVRYTGRDIKVGTNNVGQ